MAEKSTERIYTIPLRREWLKASRVKRTPRAVSAIKNFLSRHMKAEKIVVSQKLNETIWKRGVHKPPAKIKVKAKREGEIVKVMLPEEGKEQKEKEKKVEKETKS